MLYFLGGKGGNEPEISIAKTQYASEEACSEHKPSMTNPRAILAMFLVLIELKPGCRLQLLSEEFSREANGEGLVMAATGTEGRYLVRLDSGAQKLIRLDCEHFRLLR